jgi:nitrile hydratase alpha subunit
MKDQSDELAARAHRCEVALSTPTSEPAHELEPEQERRWAQVVARAWDDEEFRRRLLAQPREVLREEGFDVPDDAEVELVDGEPERLPEGVTCLRLPPRPATDDLIEDQLSLPEESAQLSDRDQ